MSDLTIFNSSFNTTEAIAQAQQPKANARTIEQDDTQAPKRFKSTTEAADDTWEYALEHPLDRREPALNDHMQGMTNQLITANHPETEGRLIVSFNEDTLITLFTYLDIEDIASLILLCKLGDTRLKEIFFSQANRISQIIYRSPFNRLDSCDRTATIKLLDASDEYLKSETLVAKGQAIIHEIYNSLEGTEDAISLSELHESFDKSYFNGDENAFYEHVASFDFPIYQNKIPNLVERFKRFKKELANLPTLQDEHTPTIRQYEGDAPSNEECFFPLRLIENPIAIEKLTLRDMGFKTLPPQIADCVQLQSLHIEQVAFLPREIGKLTSLEHLSFYYHALDKLPAEIVNLTNLKSLTFEAPDQAEYLKLNFDSLTDAQKEWLWTLKENGCVIEMMDVPPRP